MLVYKVESNQKMYSCTCKTSKVFLVGTELGIKQCPASPLGYYVAITYTFQ